MSSVLICSDCGEPVIYVKSVTLTTTPPRWNGICPNGHRRTAACDEVREAEMLTDEVRAQIRKRSAFHRLVEDLDDSGVEDGYAIANAIAEYIDELMDARGLKIEDCGDDDDG